MRPLTALLLLAACAHAPVALGSADDPDGPGVEIGLAFTGDLWGELQPGG